MTGIAVVASTHDAKFAEEVRAALQAAGRDASVSQSLPKTAGPNVVLIWSAALETGHAIDAQALIGLWSEDRLVTVRRDETPLPLGLRDLPSLSPGSTAEEVCAAVPGARYTTAGPPAAVEQVLVGSMADAATRDAGVKQKLAEKKVDPEADLAAKAEVATREADLKEKLAEAPKQKKTIRAVIGALVAIVIVGGGAWYYFNKGSLEKQAALTVALESATKATQELRQAHVRELEALLALEKARSAEDQARKAGDPAKLKEAQEAARRAEAEAAKQAEAVKQREAAAANARMKAQGAASRAKSAATAKAKAPANAEVAALPPVAEAPKAEAPAAKAPEPAVAKSAPTPMSRAERERSADEAAARKSLASAGKREAEKVAVASAAPSEAAPADPRAKPASDFDALYRQAVAMEQEGRAAESVRIYRRAARAGSGKAAKRLGEIYDKGVPGVSRDYAESLQWYETARQLGEKIETAGSRGRPETPVAKAPAPAPVPAVREPVKAAPASAAKPAPAPVKAAEPVPVPAPAAIPEPPKAAAPAPSPAPAPEMKPGWFSMRGLLIALFVLALIAWRRSRRRQKAEARQAQRAPAAANRKDATVLAAARPAQRPQAPPPGDATLFVSYSHKDRDRVEPVVSVIEEMGRRVWMDRSDITGQTGWAGQIVRAIRECRAVVLMASPNSYTSDQVVRELYLAMNHRKTIVPIEIEPAEMPDELQYILAPFQHHRLSGRETREVLGRALAAV